MRISKNTIYSCRVTFNNGWKWAPATLIGVPIVDVSESFTCVHLNAFSRCPFLEGHTNIPTPRVACLRRWA